MASDVVDDNAIFDLLGLDWEGGTQDSENISRPETEYGGVSVQVTSPEEYGKFGMDSTNSVSSPMQFGELMTESPPTSPADKWEDRDVAVAPSPISSGRTTAPSASVKPVATSDEDIVRSIILKFEGLPAHMRQKVWTENDIFSRSESQKLRLLIGDKVGAPVTLEIFEDTAFDATKKKRKRWTEMMPGDTHSKDIKEIMVELINACCRPQEEKVWLGNPELAVDKLNDHGEIHKMIRYLKLTLMELRKRRNDEHNATVDDYEDGLTLNEYLEENPDVAAKFGRGNRGTLGWQIQKEIMRRNGITKEEFNNRHKKKKLEYSEATYACVYRPEEKEIMKCVIQSLA